MDAPRVWILCGDKAGDNAQLRAIGRALVADLGAVTRDFELGRIGSSAGPGRWRQPTFSVLADGGAELERALTDEAPDLVLASGRRVVPVLRHLRNRANGRPRLVLIGRPRAPLDWFDLVITSPQYGLPEHPRVLRRSLPVPGATADEIASGAREWASSLAGDRPFHAVLVGGNADPWVFDDQTMSRLSTALAVHAERERVDLAVTCGRRVPAAAGEILRVLLEAEGGLRSFHHFGSASANPYRAYLGLASGFIVTVDSVSMMAEAVATGRPVALFRPARRPSLRHRGARLGLGIAEGLLSAAARDRAIAAGWIVPQRDTEAVAEALVQGGRAIWLGEERSGPRPSTSSGMADIVDRITSLLTDTGSGSSSGERP